MLLYFGIFVRYFFFGWFDMVSLAYDNGIVHAIGAEIPAPSDAIHF